MWIGLLGTCDVWFGEKPALLEANWTAVEKEGREFCTLCKTGGDEQAVLTCQEQCQSY